MGKRKTQKGICRLCKKEKLLTFEHIPPRSAFNKHTRYYSLPFEDYVKIQNPLEYKPKGNVQQGGHGFYSLCDECNNFLGKNYVRPYANWANLGMNLNLNYTFDVIHFFAEKQNPLRVLKQVVSMFICINDPWFTNEYPELLTFVKSPESNELPDRYHIYTYLNSEGQMRVIKWTYSNIHGIISEITFRPFGYVLSIDNNDNEIDRLTDISFFKNFSDKRDQKLELTLFKHPTYLPIPLDYRSKNEIEKSIKQIIKPAGNKAYKSLGDK